MINSKEVDEPEKIVFDEEQLRKAEKILESKMKLTNERKIPYG